MGSIAAGPVGDPAFIFTEQGNPYAKEGNPYAKESPGNVFKESGHELRKAAATRAADNGAPANELMAIFGWIDIKEAEI